MGLQTMIRRGCAHGLQVVASLVVLFSGSARAQSTPDVVPTANGNGLDTHLFRPALDSKGLFSVNGSDVLGAKEMSFGLVLDYGHNLLRAGGSALVENSFQGTIQANYGVANVLVVGLDMPVDLASGSPQSAYPGQWGPGKLEYQGVSFFAAHAKWRILKSEQAIGLAVGLQIGGGLSGAASNASADPGFWYWPSLIVDKRFGPGNRLRIALNGGYRGHVATGTTLPLDAGSYHDGDLLTYGGGLGVRVLEQVDLAVETYGTYLTSTDAGNSVKMSNEAIGGLKLFVERNSYLMLAGGVRYTSGFEAADQRVILGFTYEPSIGDRDGDGIKDDVDQCPDEPEDFDGFKDEDGCPDPDNDNDGIPDVDDHCPNVPEDHDGFQDEDGCPEVRDGDRDGDGIPDSKDKCPDQPEDRDGFQDDDGCPDPDNDGDGILDKDDKCPNDPEDKDGFEDEDGCPDPDNDKDGIPDVLDKCPNEPETFNGFEDEDGCPDKGSVVIQDNNILILEKIKFKTGSAEILPASNSILDMVSIALQHHPEFDLLEIAGHADERSTDEYNLRLTQLRVDSVMRAIVARGIAASRLRSKGYGEYCPEDPGHNEAAWEKNRRVEFKILKKDGVPTGVELGCPNAVKHGVASDQVK